MSWDSPWGWGCRSCVLTWAPAWAPGWHTAVDKHDKPHYSLIASPWSWTHHCNEDKVCSLLWFQSVGIEPYRCCWFLGCREGRKENNLTLTNTCVKLTTFLCFTQDVKTLPLLIKWQRGGLPFPMSAVMKNWSMSRTILTLNRNHKIRWIFLAPSLEFTRLNLNFKGET